MTEYEQGYDMASDPETWPCVDHGLADCPDCEVWQEPQRVAVAELEAARAERDRYRALLLLVSEAVPADWKNGTKRQREVYRGLTEVLADQRRMESSDAR